MLNFPHYGGFNFKQLKIRFNSFQKRKVQLGFPEQDSMGIDNFFHIMLVH